YEELPTAVNITWSSINFKTILQWQPKPSGYFYTVEIHGRTSDVKRKCILTSETECDVTDALRNVKETYTAHILSVMRAEMDNFEEPPFAVSEKFTPYSQTVIGKPEIKDYSQEGSKLNVMFKDPLTPYVFPNGSFQSIQDIFQHDLEYKLYYWKDQSSGKKDVTTKSHNFEVSVDSGKSYCFYVQGIIPSRRENRNGQESMVLCTSVGRNILDEYGTEVFIILAVIAVAVITLAIVLPVVLCKRKKARAVREKELLNESTHGATTPVCPCCRSHSCGPVDTTPAAPSPCSSLFLLPLSMQQPCTHFYRSAVCVRCLCFVCLEKKIE
ncbi:Tissue factor, partial [Lamprotornis superbus]